MSNASPFNEAEMKEMFSKTKPVIQTLTTEIGECFHKHLPAKEDKSLLIYPQAIEAALIYHMAVAIELRANIHGQSVEDALEMIMGGIRMAVDARTQQFMNDEEDDA